MKRIAFAIFAALAFAGCRTSQRGFSPPSITATLSATNHVGAAISGGNQISAMLDKDAVLATYRDVAMMAAQSGTEMSLTSIGHGASKQPNVQRESKATEKLTNSLASAIKAAKSGGNDPQALAKFGADLVSGLVELSEEAANPPASDDTSLLGFDLKVGPGANLAGIAVAETMARTRIETVKAARSTYSRVNTTDTQESNTPAGIKEITGAMVELQKLSTGGAASPAPATPGNSAGAGSGGVTPSPVAPDSSGSGAVEPSDRPAYDTLTKKNYLYKTRLAKTNPVTRHDSAFLIPKDRPAVKSLYIPGQKVEENYFSKSEDRWILRLSGALPNTPASAVATYADGNSETFHIDSLAGRTDKPARPYKPDVKPTTPAPVTPDAGAGTPPGE